MKKTSKKTSKKISTKTISAAKRAVANRNRRVARANKAFRALSPANKRVHIARDVLKQLASKRLLPQTGYWLDDEYGGVLTNHTTDQNAELRDILAKQKVCTGCALGGMFMAAVEAADQFKVCDLNTPSCGIEQDDVFEYLDRFFSSNQLQMIEAAFERGKGACDDEDGGKFLADESDPGKRMQAIMENIIANKGTFDPFIQPLVEKRYITPGFKG